MDKRIIAPIAVDFGAKTTGVYYAHYRQGTALADIKKRGEVLTYDKYTVLLKDRTAHRHTRRNYDRRKMAKRLLRLVLIHHFDFPAGEHMQALGWLLNRRGYNRLEDALEPRYLEDFPDEACEELNAVAPDLLEDGRPSERLLADLASDGLEAIMKSVKALEKQSEENKQNKASIWNFKIQDFNLETQQDKLENPEKKGHAKAHLHHYCHAAWKIKEEMQTGHRHRREYIKDIKEALDGLPKRKESYLKNFADVIDKCRKLDNDKLHHLIGHVSNLELKPLRAYFNCKSHKGGDQWYPDRLSEISRKWFMKQWRVDEKADGLKKVEDYKELKDSWKKWPDKQDIVGFWLKTSPLLTIPPYQDMSNRHPPRCQTLLLNPDTMDKKYPEWKNWLAAIESDGASYRAELEREKKLIPLMVGEMDRQKNEIRRQKHIDLRVLQFLLDRRKDTDPFRLNEIWSHHHKSQQQRRDGENDSDSLQKIEDFIARSELPSNLKVDLKFDQQGSFGHFVNAYYQARHRARDGRYFLIQNKKGHWIDDGKLLYMCPHRPKQKRHQWQLDLARIFGLGKIELDNKVGEDIESWLKSLRVESHCRSCAQAQKRYRGELKQRIDYGLDKELNKLDKHSKEHSKKIAQSIWPDTEDSVLLERKAEKFNSVFSFAQIYNIAFAERNGFSGTCPACSLDNSERMRVDDKDRAHAARLPALSIRLIDGVVMRICEILSHRIAQSCWEDIKDGLVQSDHKICIPLIMEQNRFAFEPSLADMKGKKSRIQDDNREKIANERQSRIEDASEGICPYTGEPIGKGAGDIDHIIPRKSKYGVLNDEANLIYASKKGNRDKGNKFYGFGNLSAKYKKKIFPDCNGDDAIISWIKNTIETSDADSFTFGPYRNFINLEENQKKAFRHALFLHQDPLREKVIRAIQNRNRAIVNGTQRYFAQCIADKLHAIAKAKGVKGVDSRLEFDYFEFSSNPDGKYSTYDLRRAYSKAPLADGTGECLENYDKKSGERQDAFSHVVDAQMAFLLAANQHKRNGAMGIDMPEDLHDVQTFTVSAINSGDDRAYRESALSRGQSRDGVRTHRSFNRGTFYSRNYLSVLLGKQDDRVEIRCGFSWDKSIELPKKQIKHLGEALPFVKVKASSPRIPQTDSADAASLYHHLEQNNAPRSSGNVITLPWDRMRVHSYLVEHMNNADIAQGKKWNAIAEFFNSVAYRTERKEITLDLLQTLPDCSIPIGSRKIELPVKADWQRLKDAWEEFKQNDRAKDGNDHFHEFLRKFFKVSNEMPHTRTRKHFSLPVSSKKGHILQRRSSWSGNDIYQVIADSDSRKDGNKPFRMVLSNNELMKEFNWPFTSKRQFKLSQEKDIVSPNDKIYYIPEDWFELSGVQLPSGVSCAEYKIEDVSRPKIRIELAKDYSAKRHAEGVASDHFTKPKEVEKLKLALGCEETFKKMCNESRNKIMNKAEKDVKESDNPDKVIDRAKERVKTEKEKLRRDFGCIKAGDRHEYTGSGFPKKLKQAIQRAVSDLVHR